MDNPFYVVPARDSECCISHSGGLVFKPQPYICSCCGETKCDHKAMSLSTEDANGHWSVVWKMCFECYSDGLLHACKQAHTLRCVDEMNAAVAANSESNSR